MLDLLTYGWGMASLLPLLFYFFIPLAPLIFIIIKWRSDKNAPKNDSQLGIKAILYYFKTISYHGILLSFAILLINIVNQGPSMLTQMAVGILVGSGIVYIVHILLIVQLTNANEFHSVAKYYCAYNIIITGLVGFSSMILFFVFLITGDNAALTYTFPLLIVYGISWTAQIIILLNIPIMKNLFKKNE